MSETASMDTCKGASGPLAGHRVTGQLWQNQRPAALAARRAGASCQPFRPAAEALVPATMPASKPHMRRPSGAGADVADEVGHLPRRPGRILKATIWSLQGLRAAWLHESSFRLEVYLFAVLAPLALWLGQNGLERALLVCSMLLVLSIELVNSAIEAVIERFGDDFHELAGRAKDMGSAAVFVLMLNVILVWGLILVPRYL